MRWNTKEEGRREGKDLLSGESIGKAPKILPLNTKKEETKGITNQYSMYSCNLLVVSMGKNRNRNKNSNNSINKSYSINRSNNKPETIW